ncbi:MAG: Flp family type IVb pilin [Coriobacteriia bacterium]|nr:Flp family type IVb pilin [Coriobacteriia bacterium]
MFTKLYVKAQTLRASEEGATATEYGLLVAFIAFVIIAGVGLFGGALNAFFIKLQGAVNGWNP